MALPTDQPNQPINDLCCGRNSYMQDNRKARNREFLQSGFSYQCLRTLQQIAQGNFAPWIRAHEIVSASVKKTKKTRISTELDSGLCGPTI